MKQGTKTGGRILALLAAGAFAIWAHKKNNSVSGIGDLTAWNKRHLADYFDRNMWYGRVVVNTGAVDDRGYYPVDFYTDKDRTFSNFTYLISPNNIEYLKDLCRQYQCDFETINGGAYYPNVHKVGKINPNRKGTRVIFKKFPDGEVIAFFPDEKWTYGQCASYMHYGQHGGADYMLIRELKPATPQEYAPLLRELEQIGYDDLIIAHRV